MIDPELLAMLACPNCRSAVQLAGDQIFCSNPQCGLRYPIRDDIPVMLIDQAEQPPRAK